jgi:hypothetical protein
MLGSISDTSLHLLAAGASGAVVVSVVLGLWLAVRSTGRRTASPSPPHTMLQALKTALTSSRISLLA